VHFVYIVRCADGSLYTGYARDPHARANVHNAGRGAKYTASRLPVTVVFTQRFRTRSAALRREYALKQWSHAEKAALASGRAQAFRPRTSPRKPRSADP
jgi:putative endonuclease